ncbi:MAG: hypothetical protein WCK66_14930, partial [Betaproteobacteria bacterium]
RAYPRHPRQWGQQRQLAQNAMSPLHSGKTPLAAARQTPRPLSLYITAKGNAFLRRAGQEKTR